MSGPIRPVYIILNHFLLTKNKIVINSKSIINIYIVYSLYKKTISSNNALKNWLFGATRVAKPGDTKDPDKYIYSGCGLGFDRTGHFTHPQGGRARNIIIFGVDLSNAVYTQTKHKTC